MFARRNRATYQWDPVEERAGRGLGPVGNANRRILRDGDVPFPHAVRRPLSMKEALARFRLPKSSLPPDQELIDLLINAAEIEHGLMIQYLYAASAAIDTTVRTDLIKIAIEEMGHFITVQNLLVSFGAELHLSHADWVEAKYFKPFPFKLEEASPTSIAKFAIAEMPDSHGSHMDAGQKADLPAILKDARDSAGMDVEPHRVGLLYMKIYWLLRTDDKALPPDEKEPWADFPIAEAAAQCPGAHISDSLLRTAEVGRNALLKHWKGSQSALIVRPIADRKVARQAIADISAQGEGFGATEDGHFDKLVEAWRLAKKAAPAPARVAENPWYVGPGSTSAPPRPGHQIANPLGVEFARLGDKSYEVVLLAAALYLLLPANETEVVRRVVAEASIECMKGCLKPAMANLAKLPISLPDGKNVLRCGMPFVQESLAIASTAKDVLDRISNLKTDISNIAGNIKTLADADDGQKDDADGIAEAMVTEVWEKRLQTVKVGGP